MTGTITALIGCQVQECALEVSRPLVMMRFFEGKPICEECYQEYSASVVGDTEWSDLSKINLKDLKL